jgi:cell division protein FtsZ
MGGGMGRRAWANSPATIDIGAARVDVAAHRHGPHAAAARVDALSSGGMDDVEIPAFLRKQAD